MIVYLSRQTVERLRDPDALSLYSTVFRNGGSVNSEPAVPFVELVDGVKTKLFTVVPFRGSFETGYRIISSSLVDSSRVIASDMHFLSEMGLEVNEGDEVEITARVVSKRVTQKEPV